MEHKRMACWWIRWEDLNWPSPDARDRVKMRAAEYAKAKVTDVVIFGTHFRWDFLPYFELLHDYIAAVCEELHSYGIRLIDHHSVNLVHRYHTREEMRHVMLDSGPHLPFSPSFEAAETWEWKGKRLNDWRMINVVTGKPHYFEQYAGEGFCYRNPDFTEAYLDYAKKLKRDTGIDGLMADDTVHYARINTCGCAYCRAELKRRTGVDLPSYQDQSFWGNWDNPAWKAWLDLRLDACGDFQKALSEAMPEGFELMSCGGGGSNPAGALFSSDPRQFLRGCTYTNLELSGNTPPYKHDPVTINNPISYAMINASHHQAAGRETGAGSFGTGYGFTRDTANIIWAVNKVLGADCWFSTLKDRLGLPDHILKTLPDEPECISSAFHYEAEHPELFNGTSIAAGAVYFSYETRNHSYFGSHIKGYSFDYSAALKAMFRHGISVHTVFDFPKDPSVYPVVLLVSPLLMTDHEKTAMNAYLSAGGKVIATGPADLDDCRFEWNFPNRTTSDPIGFFPTIRDGVWHNPAAWEKEEVPQSEGKNAWQNPREGFFYHPFRFSDPRVTEDAVSRFAACARRLPVKVLESEGYYATMLGDEKGITVHFLAADYDTDIDHHLDEIRFHRSRMNYINKVEPIGIGDHISVKAPSKPSVFSPFTEAQPKAAEFDGVWRIELPKKASYIILRFEK